MKTKKKTSKKKVAKKKVTSKPKARAKVLIVRGREERPRMRDSVASGFGAGFGVAAGHEMGDWLFNPGRKRRNPETKWSQIESLIGDIQKDIDRIENRKEKQRLQNAFDRYLDSIAIEGDVSSQALSRHYRILEGFREKIFAVQIKEETPRLVRDIEEGRWVPFK